jgi:G3E family GTPase
MEHTYSGRLAGDSAVHSEVVVPPHHGTYGRVTDRCKGILHTFEGPTQKYSLQVVGRRTQITPIGQWRDKATTEIVAIGRDIDDEHLDGLFDSCKP